MPLDATPQHNGGEHLELLADGRMALVVTERGSELTRRETHDLDELLYWLFKKAAYARGWRWELAHRHPSDDSRRIAFARALDEIGRVSPAWRDRLEAEQRAILRDHRFRDGQR